MAASELCPERLGDVKAGRGVRKKASQAPDSRAQRRGRQCQAAMEGGVVPGRGAASKAGLPDTPWQGRTDAPSPGEGDLLFIQGPPHHGGVLPSSRSLWVSRPLSSPRCIDEEVSEMPMGATRCRHAGTPK